MFTCPHCQKAIENSLIITAGSKLMRQKQAKRKYDPNKMSKAAKVRWDAYYARMKAQEGDRKIN